MSERSAAKKIQIQTTGLIKTKGRSHTGQPSTEEALKTIRKNKAKISRKSQERRRKTTNRSTNSTSLPYAQSSQ